MRKQAIEKLGISTEYFAGYGHVNHFNHQSMKTVLESIGFDLLDSYNAALNIGFEVNIKMKLKNRFRDFYWLLSNIIMNTTGIDIGMNTMYLARKNKVLNSNFCSVNNCPPQTVESADLK